MASYSLTWDAASVGGSMTVDSHDVEYTPDGGSATVVSTSSATNSFVVTGLTDNTPYTFRVRGRDGSLVGPWSEAVVAGSQASTTGLLLNFENNLTDTGPTGYSFTGSAGASFDASNVKFGSYSRAYQTYNYDYTTGSAVSDLMNGDFTLEYFVRLAPGSLGNTVYVGSAWGIVDSAGVTYENATIYWDNYASPANAITFAWDNGAGVSAFQASSVAMQDDGNWHHIALVREGSTFRVYYDGTRIIDITGSGYGDAWASSSHQLGIGSDVYMYGYDGMDGNIDDFRISTSALYSGATITVPTSQLS